MVLVASLVKIEVRKPLKGSGGPFKRMYDGKVIVIGGSFFPYFVFVVNHHFFFFVMFWVKSCLPSAMFPQSTLNLINYKTCEIISISILV